MTKVGLVAIASYLIVKFAWRLVEWFKDSQAKPVSPAIIAAARAGLGSLSNEQQQKVDKELSQLESEIEK